MQNELRTLIEATAFARQLPEAVVEKDYYVTQVIHALLAVKSPYFDLLFTGGTCLAKAYNAVNRMSEDIDFKINYKPSYTPSSQSELQSKLRDFRKHIKSILLHLADIDYVDETVTNKGAHCAYQLNYPPIYSSPVLRNHLLVELTLAECYLKTRMLPITSIIQNTLNVQANSVSKMISCVSLSEIAAEKWVGLLRRISESYDRKSKEEDKHLIRHLYDLAVINSIITKSDFHQVMPHIIQRDQHQFRNQHPNYARSPLEVIRHSLSLLREDAKWKAHYQEFNVMLYIQAAPLHYEACISLLERMSESVISELELVYS